MSLLSHSRDCFGRIPFAWAKMQARKVVAIDSRNEERITYPVCRMLLACLILICSYLPGSAALSAPAVPEIAADNADISSPQTTLASLVRLTDVFHELVREKGFTRENQGRIRNIYQQLQKLFDLREIAPKYRRHVAVETSVYLREALARFPIPSLVDVPDEERMLALTKDGKAAFFRLPDTPVVIARTGEGIYEGRYQFTQATVAEARGWYEVTADYPYQEGQEHISGLYAEYFLTPGPMIPVELIRALPNWMQHQYMDQAVWQWGLLIVTALILLGVILLLHALVKRMVRRGNRLRKNLLYMLWSIAVIYLILGSRAFLDKQVNLSGEVLQDVLFVAKIAILAAVVSLVVRFAGVLTEVILSARHFETRRIDQQLVRLGVRMLTILIAIIVVIEGMQQIGFSLATLVAGAGVTGLAIALAAQDTLKNVFGGVLLAMDRPFEVGQRVRMKGYEGFIKEVGLRSTKIRTVKGHEIIIPNDEAARIEVENIGRRPNIRRDMNVTITYDTPPEKITRAVEILREILAVPDRVEDEVAAQPGGESTSHPNEAINQPGFPPRAFFNELNADSLNLLVTYWFHPPDRWKSIEFAHRINMQIMERFNAEGIDFAFPSQTMYLAGDSRRPLHLDQQHFPPERTNFSPDVSSTGTHDSVFQPVEKGASKYASVEEDVLSGEDGGEGEGSSS